MSRCWPELIGRIVAADTATVVAIIASDDLRIIMVLWLLKSMT